MESYAADSRLLQNISSCERLSGARSRLIAAFGAGARKRAPKQAAEAQLRFDCWMQEQEENFQPDDIDAPCRQAVGNAPVTTAQVEHLHPGFQLASVLI